MTRVNIFIEETSDKGAGRELLTSDSYAVYYVTSARAKDLYDNYCDKYSRYPTAAWLHKHVRFKWHRNCAFNYTWEMRDYIHRHAY